MGVVARAEEYLDGLRCEICGTYTAGSVCLCSRDAYYRLSASECDEWIDKLTGKDRELAIAASSSALWRSRRRAGMHGRPSDGEPTMTMDDDERVGFKLQHGVEDIKWQATKWRPSRQIITSRAASEPL